MIKISAETTNLFKILNIWRGRGLDIEFNEYEGGQVLGTFKYCLIAGASTLNLFCDGRKSSNFRREKRIPILSFILRPK